MSESSACLICDALAEPLHRQLLASSVGGIIATLVLSPIGACPWLARHYPPYMSLYTAAPAHSMYVYCLCLTGVVKARIQTQGISTRQAVAAVYKARGLPG